MAPAPARFVALGDSLTVGLGDPVPGGGWRGWAALLAGTLGERPGGVELVNLARSGALAAELAERQLPVARELAPRFASWSSGRTTPCVRPSPSSGSRPHWTGRTVR